MQKYFIGLVCYLCTNTTYNHIKISNRNRSLALCTYKPIQRHHLLVTSQQESIQCDVHNKGVSNASWWLTCTHAGQIFAENSAVHVLLAQPRSWLHRTSVFFYCLLLLWFNLVLVMIPAHDNKLNEPNIYTHTHTHTHTHTPTHASDP